MSANYTVRERQWPATWGHGRPLWKRAFGVPANGMERPQARPFELVYIPTGLPVGFYQTEEEAWAACPEGAPHDAAGGG